MRIACITPMLFAATTAHAHHGPGQFGGGDPVEVTGAVTEVRFVNPHGYIFFDWEFDRHVNEIIQTEDTITLKYGLMDIERTIHVNMDEHPDEFVPSRAGHSIGRWEGDTLVVETTHIDWPYFDPYGTPQSDQMSYVETFRVADDESRLHYTIVATDPVMFSAPVELERGWRWQPGTEMVEFYDCVAEWESSD